MIGALTLAQSIAQMENVNPSYNNPCALTAAPSGYCQIGKTGILVNFCSMNDGWAACNNQIQLNVNRGLNLDTFFGGQPGVYAGYANAASGNDPVVYSGTVAEWMGIGQGVPLSSLDPSQLFYNPNASLPLPSLDSGGAGDVSMVNMGMSNLFGGIDLNNPNTVMMIGLGLLGALLLSRIL